MPVGRTPPLGLASAPGPPRSSPGGPALRVGLGLPHVSLGGVGKVPWCLGWRPRPVVSWGAPWRARGEAVVSPGNLCSKLLHDSAAFFRSAVVAVTFSWSDAPSSCSLLSFFTEVAESGRSAVHTHAPLAALTRLVLKEGVAPFVRRKGLNLGGTRGSVEIAGALFLCNVLWMPSLPPVL